MKDTPSTIPSPIPVTGASGAGAALGSSPPAPASGTALPPPVKSPGATLIEGLQATSADQYEGYIFINRVNSRLKLFRALHRSVESVEQLQQVLPLLPYGEMTEADYELIASDIKRLGINSGSEISKLLKSVNPEFRNWSFGSFVCALCSALGKGQGNQLVKVFETLDDRGLHRSAVFCLAHRRKELIENADILACLLRTFGNPLEGGESGIPIYAILLTDFTRKVIRTDEDLVKVLEVIHKSFVFYEDMQSRFTSVIGTKEGLFKVLRVVPLTAIFSHLNILQPKIMELITNRDDLVKVLKILRDKFHSESAHCSITRDNAYILARYYIEKNPAWFVNKESVDSILQLLEGQFDAGVLAIKAKFPIFYPGLSDPDQAAEGIELPTLRPEASPATGGAGGHDDAEADTQTHGLSSH